MFSIRDLARGRPGITAGRLRGPFTVTFLAVALMIGLSVTALTRTPASASGRPGLSRRRALPIQARVSDLLGRMTLPEKIGQMVQIEATQVTDTTSNCTSQAGSTCRTPCASRRSSSTTTSARSWPAGPTFPSDTTGKGGTGNTGLDWANEYNTMQSYAIPHSRLHIPVIFGVDAVHGFGHP